MTDELNSAAKGLVAAARRSGRALEPDRRARLRSGVLAGVSTSMAAAASTASLTKLMIVGAVSAALGSGATLLAVRTAAPKLGSTTPATRIVPPAPRREPPPTPLIPAPGVSPSTPPVRDEPKAEVRQTPTAPPPLQPGAPAEAETPSVARAPAVNAPAAAGLAEELQLIRAVLAATQTQRWADAQRLLDEHERRFVPAALRSEAHAMQVVVWCGVGRVDDARRLARDLERTDPLNPAVQRLHTTCAW